MRQAMVFKGVEWAVEEGKGGWPYIVFPATEKTYDHLQR